MGGRGRATRVTSCVYASASLGIHDRRWIAALQELGWQPDAVHRDAFDADDAFVSAVAAAAAPDLPVLAGPLAIAALLVPSLPRVALLSWGFDLHAADAALDAIPSFISVIVDSSATRAIAERHGARRIVEIPWGIELDPWTPTGPVMSLSAHGIPDDAPVVLSLRAHEPLYRVQDIVAACTTLPVGTRLVIGHSGSMTDALAEQANAQGVDAVFIGSIDETALPALLRRSSVYVTASEVDGTSVTLLQAMACGVPVIASTNTGNADWVVEGVTGFTFPVGDVPALQAALLRALALDAEQRALLTVQARAQVLARADWHRNCHRLAQALDLQPAAPDASPDGSPDLTAVTAVIATYRPPDLSALLASLQPQVDAIHVVDDASPVTFDERLRALAPEVAVHRCASNTGIGRSLNIGCDAAREQGATWLLTLDQDTVLAPDHVRQLVEAAQTASRTGMQVGAVGVAIVEGSGGCLVIPTTRIGEVVVAEELIQSGTIWSLAALERIGGFDASLGMDAVDAAAGIRLQRAGYRLVVADGLAMAHAVGNSQPVRILGRTVQATSHSPERRETILRNRLRLAPEAARVSLGYAARTVRRAAVGAVLAATVEEDRWAKAKGSLRGLLPRRSK